MGRSQSETPKKSEKLTREHLLQLTQKGVTRNKEHNDAAIAKIEALAKVVATCFREKLEDIVDHSDYTSTFETIEMMLKQHCESGKDCSTFQIDMAWHINAFETKVSARPSMTTNTYFAEDSPLAKVQEFMRERFDKLKELVPQTVLEYAEIKRDYMANEYEAQGYELVIEQIATRWNIEHPDLKMVYAVVPHHPGTRVLKMQKVE